MSNVKKNSENKTEKRLFKYEIKPNYGEKTAISKKEAQIKIEELRKIIKYNQRLLEEFNLEYKNGSLLLKES